MTEKQYDVRGCTALLDAIGMTTSKIINEQKHTIDKLCAEKMILVITTDGLENASREYFNNKLKQMIGLQKKKQLYAVRGKQELKMINKETKSIKALYRKFRKLEKV